MGITANSGPHVSYGISQTSSGLVGEYNEERGPSLFDLGYGTLDPRPLFNYRPGNPVGTRLYGFYDVSGNAVDYGPFAANSSAIIATAGSGAPVAGTALTLAPLSSFGAFQTTIVAPESGQTVSVVAIDSTASVLAYGSGGTIAMWSPANCGRTITVINSSNTNAELYYVNGRDMYGIKMTELIGASTTSTGAGQGRKAFKYIQSVIPATNTTISATGVGVGFSNTFGFPLVALNFAQTTVIVSSVPTAPNTIVLTSANAAAGSTVTATSTTPDVRGTYTSSIATAGTSGSAGLNSTSVRITILQNFTANMASGVTASDQSSVFGVTQFSNF